MKKLLLVLTLAIVTIYFASCSSVTDITGSWKKPGTAAQKYNKIIVLGLSSDLVKRSTVEKSIVSNLRSYGINAIAGSNVLPDNILDSDHDGKVDDKEKVKTLVQSKFKELGVDGALIFSLLDVKEEEHYVPGSSYYMPYTSYYPFYNYYWTYYDRVNTPGYYTKTTSVFLTTNFYNVSSEELLWSAQSETVNPQSLSDFAKSYAQAMVQDFVGAGIVRK